MLDQLATALTAGRAGAAEGAAPPTLPMVATPERGVPGVGDAFIKAHARTRIAGRYRMAEVILELSHLHLAVAECCAADGIDPSPGSRRGSSTPRLTPRWPAPRRRSIADELPNGRLLQASSIVELRLAPARLTDEIATFLDECWAPRAARAA